jgi:hypothetical protein
VVEMFALLTLATVNGLAAAPWACNKLPRK